MILEQIDSKTRIKLTRFYPPALDGAFLLQRKGLIFWKTTSWIYPSVVRKHDFEWVKKWLFWDEDRNIKRRFSEFELGIKQLSNKP